jgi:hypothetical protein
VLIALGEKGVVRGNHPALYEYSYSINGGCTGQREEHRLPRV